MAAHFGQMVGDATPDNAAANDNYFGHRAFVML
jgi:hypothetical protein